MDLITGVIGGNKLTGNFWDTVDRNYINYTYDQYLAEQNIDADDENYDEIIQKLSDEYVECGDTWLYGYIKNDQNEYVFDDTADFSCIINNNENTIQVTRSSFYGKCFHCSPCYPNQGDLHTPGDLTAYHLPPYCHLSPVKSKRIPGERNTFSVAQYIPEHYGNYDYLKPVTDNIGNTLTFESVDSANEWIAENSSCDSEYIVNDTDIIEYIGRDGDDSNYDWTDCSCDCGECNTCLQYKIFSDLNMIKNQK
jgi:hypothetical protein